MRHKDFNWNLPAGDPDHRWESVHAALLMDLRDELKEANRHLRAIESTLGCHNVVKGMMALHRLDRRVAKHWPLKAKKRKGRR